MAVRASPDHLGLRASELVAQRDATKIANFVRDRIADSELSAFFALKDAADISSLPDLLKAVADHAYESYAQGYGGVPTLIDNAIEVGIGH
jgi:hypothetical protein